MRPAGGGVPCLSRVGLTHPGSQSKTPSVRSQQAPPWPSHRGLGFRGLTVQAQRSPGWAGPGLLPGPSPGVVSESGAHAGVGCGPVNQREQHRQRELKQHGVVVASKPPAGRGLPTAPPPKQQERQAPNPRDGVVVVEGPPALCPLPQPLRSAISLVGGGKLPAAQPAFCSRPAEGPFFLFIWWPRFVSATPNLCGPQIRRGGGSPGVPVSWAQNADKGQFPNPEHVGPISGWTDPPPAKVEGFPQRTPVVRCTKQGEGACPPAPGPRWRPRNSQGSPVCPRGVGGAGGRSASRKGI